MLRNILSERLVVELLVVPSCLLLEEVFIWGLRLASLLFRGGGPRRWFTTSTLSTSASPSTSSRLSPLVSPDQGWAWPPHLWHSTYFLEWLGSAQHQTSNIPASELVIPSLGACRSLPRSLSFPPSELVTPSLGAGRSTPP